MNPILRSLLNIGSRGIPKFLKQPFTKGGETPGGFRTNPFRGPKARPWKGVPYKIPAPDKGGYLYRHPTQAVLGATGLAGYGGLKAYGLLSDDDVPDDTEDKKAPPPKTVPSPEKDIVPGQREAYQKKRRKRLKKGMKQLLNQYMILSYVSPEEADNFLKAAMKMMEVDQDFNDDIYMQEAYDTVFQPGNMPTTGREAFTRLLPLVGNEDAMEIAGDWADLVPEYKEYNYMTKQRMEMRDVIALATGGDREGAIAMLIQGWQSGSFKTMPDHLVIGQSSREDWVTAASEAIDLMTTGSATGAVGGGGGQILSDTLTAAPAS